jgi:NADP-dependent 3-hydroxy acid dehydrogenase YdfG
MAPTRARRSHHPDSFARVVAFSLRQPEDGDINEILFRPTRQEL